MAGFCGAGGLGAVAINYGYYRFEDGIMWIAILFLVILVQVIQSLGMTLVKKVDRRAVRLTEESSLNVWIRS